MNIVNHIYYVCQYLNWQHLYCCPTLKSIILALVFKIICSKKFNWYEIICCLKWSYLNLIIQYLRGRLFEGASALELSQFS